MWDQLRILEPAIGPTGKYNAKELAKLLGWKTEDVVEFLKRDRSAVYRNPEADKYQDELGALAGLFRDLVAAFVPRPDSGAAASPKLAAEQAARTWLVTSISALDGASPKQKILAGELPAVRRLLAEYTSGLSL